LDAAAITTTGILRQAEAMAESAKSTLAEKIEKERVRRDKARQLQHLLGEARNDLVKAERAVSELSNRRSALEEARVRLQSSLDEATGVHAEAITSLSTTPDISALEEKLAALRLDVTTKRADFAEAKAIFDGLSREKTLRNQRLEAIGRERYSWIERASNAEKQIAILRQRQDEAERESAKMRDAPSEIDERRRLLLNQIAEAEKLRKEAADLLTATETELARADQASTAALLALSEAREASARAEERLGAARERRSEIETRIREELECEPHLVGKLAELDDNADLPEIDAVERRLEKLKGERERLGAVNLRADIEQTEIAEQRDTLVGESEDLIEAIRRLRQGIQSLNSEGRERLLAAFDAVNDQFQRLFTHLFGGGTAELQLVESDDPLDAGLEILARPPGKKPQTMTLLSGGEQALTAMALIFAVFLTNPAPICVLDEVDAPLDDHNVERFCNLMDEMSASTKTRFMIITHYPITMARMNRLFGVTMAERGVSQLVSVDLETAESFRESG
jgi:chromosome segregation protein